MSPLHNIHSLIPRPENDFGPENRPEESTPRWVEKPFEDRNTSLKQYVAGPVRVEPPADEEAAQGLPEA